MTDEKLVERLREFGKMMSRAGTHSHGYGGVSLSSDEYREAADRLSSLEEEKRVLERKYHELLFAVARKYEGEDRHETALRYIREREAGSDDTALSAGAGPLHTPMMENR